MGNQGDDNNGDSQGTQDQGKVAGIRELEKNTLDSNEQKVIDKIMYNFDKGIPDEKSIEELKKAIESVDFKQASKEKESGSDKTTAPLQLNEEEYKNFLSSLKSVYQAKQKNPNIGQKLIKSLMRGGLANSIKTLGLRRFQKIAQKEVKELEYAIKSGAGSGKVAKEAGDVIKFLKFGQAKLLSKKFRQLMGRAVNRAKKVPQNNKTTIGFP